MSFVPKQFNEVINFTRGTGATRVNAAGLIVGVDFSSTSNTITTGSKTFTLAADLNVNRDWPVGSNVIAVAQAGATGSMTGTVTSYTPSTQQLVIEVASVAGSGTSTNWRIGSLEVRRDSNGVLVETQLSNIVTFSNDFGNAAWLKRTVTATLQATVPGPDGLSCYKVTENAAAGAKQIDRDFTAALTSGVLSTRSIFVKGGERNLVTVGTNNNGGPSLATSVSIFNTTTGQFVTGVTGGGNMSGAQLNTVVEAFPNGWWKITFEHANAVGDQRGICFGLADANNAISYTGDGTSGAYFAFAFVPGALSAPANYSVIPTTTVSVTRAADSLTATATTLAALRQGEGTLVVTAQNPDNGVNQKRVLRLTGANGEIRIGKQGVGTTANFTKMAEGAGLRLMGTANSLISNNGLESIGAASTFAENNTLTVLGQSNAVTFNGTDTFGRIGSTEESVLDSLLSTRRMRGLGGSQINGAHWTGTSFIAATAVAGRVLKTVDGIGYRSINAPTITQACNEVTSGLVGGTMRNVIVGNGGFIATSDDDGETWTARTSGTTQQLNGASFGSVGGTNYFIVAGNTGQLRYSTDGINYTNATGQSGSGNYGDVHIANNIVVAVANGGAVFVSTNGTTFTAATATNTPNTLVGVTYSPTLNLWIAVGVTGTIITATDPAGTWTVQTSGTTQNLQEVGIFNNAIYIVGNTQTLLTSTNGTSYTSLTAGVSGILVGIAASPSTLLITGATGAMASSTDGTTFTSRTNNNQALNGIAFGNNRFVSVGNAANGSGYIATVDADGTVTRRVSGTTGNISNVKFLNGAFYATLSTIAVVLRSVNGVDWTTINSGIAQNDICFNGTSFIVLRLGGIQFATSQNGTTFNAPIAGLPSVQYTACDFANGVSVFVGFSGTILTSTAATPTSSADFISRTSGTTQNLNSVMYSQRDQRWYAAGAAGTLLFSEDNGVTWQSVQNAGLGAINAAGASQVNALLPAFRAGSNKIAISFKQNQVSTSLNGVSVTDSSATIPTFNAISFGDSFNGYITSVNALNNALTAAELNQVTGA